MARRTEFYRPERDGSSEVPKYRPVLRNVSADHGVDPLIAEPEPVKPEGGDAEATC